MPFPITLDHWRIWAERSPGFDWQTLNIDSFEKRFRKSQAKFQDVIGTDNPDLSRFQEHCGNMITYHGWADRLIFPRGSIDYFERVAAANGGLKAVREFDQLFTVPGMNHCAGGAAAANFGQAGTSPMSLDREHDALLAVQRWVEKASPPEHFIAATDPQPQHASENSTHPQPFTRLLCPSPEVARYSGHGDSDEAVNFSCVSSQQGRAAITDHLPPT